MNLYFFSLFPRLDFLLFLFMYVFLSIILIQLKPLPQPKSNPENPPMLAFTRSYFTSATSIGADFKTLNPSKSIHRRRDSHQL